MSFEDASGNLNSCQAFVDVLPGSSGCSIPTVGTSDLEEERIHLYPNPVSDQLFIGLPTILHNQNLQIQCFDLAGRKLEEQFIHSTETEPLLLTTAAFSSGIYFLRLSDEQGKYWVQKFVKK